LLNRHLLIPLIVSICSMSLAAAPAAPSSAPASTAPAWLAESQKGWLDAAASEAAKVENPAARRRLGIQIMVEAAAVSLPNEADDTIATVVAVSDQRREPDLKAYYCTSLARTYLYRGWMDSFYRCLKIAEQTSAKIKDAEAQYESYSALVKLECRAGDIAAARRTARGMDQLRWQAELLCDAAVAMGDLNQPKRAAVPASDAAAAARCIAVPRLRGNLVMAYLAAGDPSSAQQIADTIDDREWFAISALYMAGDCKKRGDDEQYRAWLDRYFTSAADAGTQAASTYVSGLIHLRRAGDQVTSDRCRDLAMAALPGLSGDAKAKQRAARSLAYEWGRAGRADHAMRIVQQVEQGVNRGQVGLAMIRGLCFAGQAQAARDRLGAIGDPYYHSEASWYVARALALSNRPDDARLWLGSLLSPEDRASANLGIFAALRQRSTTAATAPAAGDE
jgi:hypothetical protein